MSKIGDLIASQSGGLVAVAANAVGGFASNLLGPVSIRQGRSIGGLIPDVVIEESHRDELTITEHPVEQGAAISDHAFKQPAEVTARYGWSNSAATLAGGIAGVLGVTDAAAPDVSEVYQTLLALQESREPFDLITGKRVYADMLIRSLQLHTDATSENALMVTVTMRQVIIVQTRTTNLKPAANHSQPQNTAETENVGTVAPASRKSLLLSGAQALGLSP